MGFRAVETAQGEINVSPEQGRGYRTSDVLKESLQGGCWQHGCDFRWHKMSQEVVRAVTASCSGPGPLSLHLAEELQAGSVGSPAVPPASVGSWLLLT